MNITKIILLLAAALIPLGAQQQTSSGQSKAKDPIAEAKQNGFDAGWKLALQVFAPNFGDSPDKLNIRIDVEDIDGKDAFRFAAARKLSERNFPNTFKSNPNRTWFSTSGEPIC